MLTTVAVIGLIVFVGGLGIVLGLGPERPVEEPRLPAQPEADRSRFFVLRTDGLPSGELPAEVLLSRLEQHVRQERAVVEQFPDRPSREDLRARTSSPLAN